MTRVFVVFVCLFTSLTISMADEMTWTGASGDNRWENPNNWDRGKVPGENDNVTIPSGTPTCNIPNVKVNSFINDGTIDDAGSGLRIETKNEFSNRGTISSNRKVDIHSDSQLSNNGNITGKPVSVEGNVVENSISGVIKGYSSDTEFEAVDIYATSRVNNRGTITSDQSGDDNFLCFLNITTDSDGEVHNYGIIAGDDVASGRGGDVSIKTEKLVNNGEIRSGNSGSDDMDGNTYIYAFDIDNTGTLSGGQSTNKTLSPNIIRQDQEIVIGNVTLFADSIAIHLDNRYIDADTLRIVCRKLKIFDITVPRSIWGNSCIKIFTTSDGSVDLSGTRTQYAINTEPPDGFTRIYSNTIIAPPEGLNYIFDPPPITSAADISIVGGDIHSSDASGEAGSSDSIHITMQNLSTTSKSLDYTVSSLKGWVIPAAGSFAEIHPFAFAEFDVNYTIPDGTTPGEEDTVTAIVSIAPGFTDTTFSRIYCAGEPEPCQIEVISPNGGLTWCSGSRHGITWETVNTSGQLCIEYSSDGGQTWHNVVDGTPDDGVHPWTVPGLQTDDCLVRICDCTNALCCDISNDVFSICTSPQAEFTTDPQTGSGQTCQVQFTDQSTGCVTGWVWDFGDGGASTNQNPIHTFACNGPNSVRLIATGPCGSDTAEHIIECTCPSHCSLAIAAPVCNQAGCETLCTGDLYHIVWTAQGCQEGLFRIRYSTDSSGNWTNITTTADTTYDWTVPDMASIFDALIEVCCIDAEPVCCDTSFCTIMRSPQADFTADPQNNTGETCQVNFTDQSLGFVTAWSWDFGDGGASTDQNPVFTFDCDGFNSISLIVTGPCGADTVEHEITCACPSPCSLAIIAPACTPAGCETLCTGDLCPLAWTARECQNEQYHLRYSTDHGASWTDMGTTADTIYDWIIPQVTWPNSSLIEICCTGESLPCCDTVAFSIAASPQADFIADPQMDIGQTCHVGFTDLSSNCITSWFWDFGDGGTSTVQNPNHMFQCNGSHTISLTVTGPCGEDTEIKIDHITCTCPPSHTRGDVNCDGNITPGDALCAFWRAILGSFQEECECQDSEQAADVNCDGTITPGDALCIFWRSILGEWTEECQCEP